MRGWSGRRTTKEGGAFLVIVARCLLREVMLEAMVVRGEETDLKRDNEERSLG